MITTIISSVKEVPIVGGFVSKIFKKPQTKDGFGKFIEVYSEAFKTKGIGHYPPFVPKFMNRQTMILKEKKECTSWVLERTRNWTKAQKKSLEEECKNIKIISEAVIKAPEVHTLSASYNPQVIDKSRDVQEVVQAGITKFPMWLFVVIGGVLFLPALLKGGKK